jgi:hypothetical protein
VFSALTVLGSEAVLSTLVRTEPLGGLPVMVLKLARLMQSGGTQVELSSTEVLTEMFQYPNDCKYLTLGDKVICLGLVHCLTVVGCYSFLFILYLGEHSSNPNVTCVCVNNDELLSWLQVSKNMGRIEGLL